MSKGKIAVTGANGNLGRLAAQTLLELVPADQLILTSSRVEKLADFAAQGIDCREADFANEEQMKQAFAGAQTLLLVSLPQVGSRRRMMHTNALMAARAAGVERIVYTSITGADLLENAGYEIADHRYTEYLIMALGFKYIFMRNSQYAEAMIAAVETAAKTTHIIRNNQGEGKMAHVSRKDCAVAAAYAAASDYENQAFYISGDKLRDMKEFISVVAPAFGCEIGYEYISDEENYEECDKMGIPRETDGEWVTEEAKNSPFCSRGMVTFGTEIRLGHMATCTDDFEKLTGRPKTTLAQMIANVAEYGIGERNATD